MYIFKQFLQEKSGIAIIEYIILFSLLGSVVAVATPSIREQVGLMYEKQIHSTNNLNGMIDSKVSERFNLDDSTQIVRPPTGSLQNEGGFAPILNPTPITDNPATKIVSKEEKNLTGTFEPEISYNENGYSGMIQLKSGTLSSQIIEQRVEVLTKDVSKIITKSTTEEFDIITQIDETDTEGYTGTLTPVGNIEPVMTGMSDTPSISSKASGPVIQAIESSETDPIIIATKFPDSFVYDEVISSPEEEPSYTDYSGTVTKTGTPTSIYIGQVSTPDYRNALQNRDFTNEVDVTLSQINKSHRIISSTKGYNIPTNPNTYNSTYYYNDGANEGLLNYVSKGSTKLSTHTDVINVTWNITSSTQPNPTHTYNINGYTGILNAVNAAEIVSGSYTESISKTETDSRSSYSNNLPNNISYNSGGYVGTLYGQGVTSNSYSDGYYQETGYYRDITETTGRWEYHPEWGYDPSCDISGGVESCMIWWVETTTVIGQEWVSTGSYWVDTSYTIYYQNYSGTVIYPAVDTRIWSRDYAGTASKVIDTYEYYGDYTGIIFNIQPRDNNVAPVSIIYTDPQSYTGTLYKNNINIISSLKSIRTTTTPKTVTNHKVYTTGDFASSSNTQTYPTTYAYSDAGQYNGTLNYVSKNTEFSFSQREGHRIENQSLISSSNIFNNTILYNSGGFDGTLNKNGPSNTISGAYTPAETKTVQKITTNSTNSFSATYNYNESGYVGTLSKLGAAQKIGTTVPVPADTISYTDIVTKVESNFFDTSYPYDIGNGYSGTLTKSGSPTVIQGTFEQGVFINDCSPDDYACIDPLQDLAESRPCNCLYFYQQMYYGDMTRPAGTTTVYHYEQTYQGSATKPAFDTRIYQQDYSGIVSTIVNYYKHFALYSGAANRTNYLATYNYNANYEGTISKNIMKNNYRYQQTYNGTLSKEIYSFIYEYQRNFTGTLFKETTEDIIEYTQTYEGTVEEVR